MLLGLGLFWVGAVLFCNGLWVLGKIGDKEIGVIDVFVGSLTLLIALYLAFGPGADLESVKGATFLLLFAITCAPIFLQTLLTSHGNFWQIWLAINWASWGILWFLFYLILAHGRTELSKFTGTLCTAQGVYTGWRYLVIS